MAIRANDQQVLDDLYAQYKSAYGGAKQDYFALAYLRKRFKIEIDDLKYRVAFNGNDYGIDAYFIDGEAHNLYLYQFKWTENYALFKDSMVRLTNYGIDRVFGNPTQDTTQNELIVYLKKELMRIGTKSAGFIYILSLRVMSMHAKRAKAWLIDGRT